MDSAIKGLMRAMPPRIFLARTAPASPPPPFHHHLISILLSPSLSFFFFLVFFDHCTSFELFETEEQQNNKLSDLVKLSFCISQ